MKLFRLLTLSAALGAAYSPAQAQSLVELYESARSYDASYQSAKAQYDANQFRAEQARAGLLPSANLTAGASRSLFDNSNPQVERAYGTQNIALAASQPLYRPANRITFDQSRRQLELAEGQLAAAEQDLITRVSQAYFDVLAAQDSLAFVRALKTAVNEQLAFAKRNFEVGTSTITDTREAQARYDLATAQELAAENDLLVKKLALDTLVGRTGTQPAALAQPVQLP
ncbi:MAG: TolC family protein, partial [Burkholderiaceae bacterium]|nr:TolC family protein [Burkholderiaceae bacterium]